MKNKLDEIIGNLSKEERKILLKKLEEIIIEEFNEKNNSDKIVECCPKCGSTQLWKVGKYKNN